MENNDKGRQMLYSLIKRRYPQDLFPGLYKKDGTPDIEAWKKERDRGEDFELSSSIPSNTDGKLPHDNQNLLLKAMGSDTVARGKKASIEKVAKTGESAMKYFWNGFYKEAQLAMPSLNKNLSRGMSMSAMKPVIKPPKISSKKSLMLPTPQRISK